jgi:hypothetical protein
MRTKQVIATLTWWAIVIGCVAPACTGSDHTFDDGQAATGGSAAGSPDVGGSAGAGQPSGGDGSAGQSSGEACGDVVCAREATCETTPDAHCVCPDGYTDPRGDGTSCKDIDECESENGGCSQLVDCVNTPGSFSCGICPEGFSADRGDCVDTDECAVDNGGCDPLVACSNTEGSYSCGGCPFGYTGEGSSSCEDIDECATANGGCDESVTCKNTPGSFTCGDCPAGYTGGGDTGCTDIDECKTSNGGCHAQRICTNTEGSYSCGACKATYHGCNGDNTTCYASNDKDHCGNSCAACALPNATATCSNGSCSYACPAGLSLGCLRADGSPVCSKWDFETNLPSLPTEGLLLDLSTTTGSDGVFAQSTKHATSGTHSLAIGFTGNGSNEVVDVKLPLCPGGQGLDLTKRTLTMSVYPETKAGTTPYPSNQNGNYVIAFGKNGDQFGGCDGQTPPPDARFDWVCEGSSWSMDVVSIVLRFRVHQAWQGTFYIDNIKLQ